MTAAAITPTVVCKREIVLNAITGTPVRCIEYYLKGTKAYQNDWILIETAIGDTTKSLIDARAVVVDSSSDLAEDVCAYTTSTDKMVFSASTVGTLHVWIRMQQA